MRDKSTNNTLSLIFINQYPQTFCIDFITKHKYILTLFLQHERQIITKYSIWVYRKGYASARPQLRCDSRKNITSKVAREAARPTICTKLLSQLLFQHLRDKTKYHTIIYILYLVSTLILYSFLFHLLFYNIRDKSTKQYLSLNFINQSQQIFCIDFHNQHTNIFRLLFQSLRDKI